MPLVRRTRATFRSAEFGFFGVCVNTLTQTPRFCGLTWSAGLFVLVTIFVRPWRTSWLMVGMCPREHRVRTRIGAPLKNQTQAAAALQPPVCSRPEDLLPVEAGSRLAPRTTYPINGFA